MAFDAGMLACTLHEICSVGQGGRIERVLQPERDEIVLQMRTTQGGKRLLINAGSNNPRIGFTELQKENPQQPPMFCMLLRKHLSGANCARQDSLALSAFASWNLKRAMKWALPARGI